MKGFPLLIEIPVSTGTTDDVFLLSNEYDANGDGNPEAIFADKHLLITGIEGAVAISGDIKVVIDNRTVVISESDGGSGNIAFTKVFSELGYYGEPLPVFGEIRIKKSAAPTNEGKIKVYAIVVPNDAE